MIHQSHFWAHIQTNYNSKRYMHPYVHSNTIHIAKTWKQPKCPSTDEWIQEMWHKYTIEHCSTTRHEILPFTATWIQLETAILSKAGQKDKYL